MKTETSSPEVDSFIGVKHIGYCMAFMPNKDISFKEFVQYCKFQLCVVNRRLMNDLIWSEYTNEEILSEYYAHKFLKDEEFTAKFEASVFKKSIVDDFEEFVRKDQERELKKKLDSLEEKISFNPERDVLGEG